MPHLPTTTAFSRDFEALIRDELTAQECVTVANICERHPWGSTAAVEEWTEVELQRYRITIDFGGEWFLRSATVEVGGVWFRVTFKSMRQGKATYGVDYL